MEYRARQRQRKRERRRQASEKKSDRDLEREIKNTKETFFCRKNNTKFCNGGEKMRNASGH